MKYLTGAVLGIIWPVMAQSIVQASEVTLEEMQGPLCPDADRVQPAPEDNRVGLRLDLSGTSPVITSVEEQTVRRSCSVHLVVRPGEGKKITGSNAGFTGGYKAGKSGVAFVSVGQNLADGTATDYLNRSSPPSEAETSGCLAFEGPLTDWAAHKVGCGRDVPLTVTVSATSRQAVGSGPTEIKAKELVVRWEVSSCEGEETR